MVSQCLNPSCKAPFLYLRDGLLFAVPQKTSSGVVEHFWLCKDCAARFDLQIGVNNQPVIVPRQKVPRQKPRDNRNASPARHAWVSTNLAPSSQRRRRSR